MDKIVKVLLKSVIVNICLVIAKLIIGFIGNSKSLIANAIHSLSDLITDIISIFGYKMSKKPADEKHPLGFGQIEYLTNIIVSFVILYLGIQTLLTAFNAKQTLPSSIIMFISLFTAFIKYALSKYIYNKGKEYQNGILLVSGIESKADALTSGLVVISVIFSMLTPYNEIYRYSDNVCTFIISLYIIYIAIKILKENIINIIGTSPEEEYMSEEIKSIILDYKEIDKIEEFSIIKYGSYYVAIMELKLKKNISLRKINKLKFKLRNSITTYDKKITYIKISVN